MTTTMEAPVMSAARACYTPAFCPMPPRMEGLATGPNLATLQGDHLPEKVFVGGLAEKTTEQDLREIFTQHAPVKTVKIITDKSLTSKNGEPRRYAFIEFHSAEDAKAVLTAFGPDSTTGETPQLELHGRRLNIGSAFKKTPTFGRTFGPAIVPTIADPYQMYNNPWMFAQPPKSPIPAGMNPYYAVPYYGAQHPFMQLTQPSSPNYGGLARQATYTAGQLSPGPSGVPTQNYAQQLAAYQMAQTMLHHMAAAGQTQSTPSAGVALNDLDGSYLNSSSTTSSSSRNAGSDRSGSDRYPGYGAPTQSLPSGHLEQRERNGRIISIPQPIRVQHGPASPFLQQPQSPTGYGPATGLVDNGYLAASGMRQYIHQH